MKAQIRMLQRLHQAEMALWQRDRRVTFDRADEF